MVAPDRATKAATADESGDRAVRRRTALVAGLGFVAGVGVPASIATLGDDESSTSPPEPGDTSEPSSVVDGVSRSGVTDPDRVAVGHVEAIAERSYSLAATKTVRGRAGRLLSAFRTDIDVSPDQGFLVHVSARGPAAPAVVGEPPARADYWSDGQQYVRRLSNATRAVSGEYTPNDRLDQQFYWSRTVPFGGRPFTAMFFYRDVFETVPTEALRVGDPAAVGYLLVDAVDRLERPASIWTALARNRAVEAIDLLGTVTPRGIVDTLDLHYRGTDGEQPLEVHWRIDYRHVGETVVERPTWVDRALRV